MATTVDAVQRCMDANLAPIDDATMVAIDLRTAVNGMLSQRINEPDMPWPPPLSTLTASSPNSSASVIPDHSDSRFPTGRESDPAVRRFGPVRGGPSALP
ncbi:hypothetical protein [Nocardia sp. NPDC059228]|uniref:hypothetical protein n=1 Tax=Nocardia sp. NPDC059228 TaxID=3346777 RepID=UPI0036910AA5